MRHLDQRIRGMVNRLVERFAPERIILFGSWARGEAGPDSDVDLLVVMDVAGSKRAVVTEAYRLLQGSGLAKDIIVARPDEVERYRDVGVPSSTRPCVRGRSSMSELPEREALVRGWVVKAEHDLRNAEHTLTLEEDCPLDTVAFHAQQCVEKYLKALLVRAGGVHRR
jgi:predicted nucleotidyltransferase